MREEFEKGIPYVQNTHTIQKTFKTRFVQFSAYHLLKLVAPLLIIP